MRFFLLREEETGTDSSLVYTLGVSVNSARTFFVGGGGLEEMPRS